MKSIPVTLQAHKDAQASAACHLVRITPVVGNNSPPVFGVTSLDVDVVYDDGNGPLTYYASNGADISSIASSLNLDVDNAEITSLLSEFDIGTITEADVASGKLDYAEFIVYLVNPDDLAAGHEIVSAGTLGEARTIDGASVVVEMRGLSQKLKRSIVERDSIRCRAIFGSMAGDPGVRFPCNFDVSAEWIAATVSGVGAEPDRQFALSGVAVPDGFLAPGVVEWLTGANAGRTHEIESQTGATFDLAYHTDFDIAVGDTARVRRDCAKRYNEDCIAKFNNRQNFRGEPLIPLGEEGSKQASASAPAAPANPPPVAVAAPPGPSVPVTFTNLDGESSGGWDNRRHDLGTITIRNNAALAHSGAGYIEWVGNTDNGISVEQDVIFVTPEFLANPRDTISISAFIAIDRSIPDMFMRVDPMIEFSLTLGGPSFAGPVGFGRNAVGADVPYSDVSVVATVPDEPVVYARVGFVLSTTRSTGTLRIDDVVISATTPA